jgi:hypothetical protein
LVERRQQPSKRVEHTPPLNIELELELAAEALSPPPLEKKTTLPKQAESLFVLFSFADL